MTSDKILAEARRLSQLMLDAADESRDVFNAIAKDLDVPFHLARALCMLSKPTSMTELAINLGCDKSYITPLADQMESLGLLNRIVGEDRRIKLLNLTPKGQKLRDELENKISQLSPIMVRLSKKERETLDLLLVKIVESGKPSSNQK